MKTTQCGGGDERCGGFGGGGQKCDCAVFSLLDLSVIVDGVWSFGFVKVSHGDL